MNIGVDIRSLLEPKRSGVGEYTYNLLDAIFRIDKENNYFLFYNSFRDVPGFPPNEWRGLSNVHFCGFKYPNKFLNFCFKFLRWPKVDKLIEGALSSLVISTDRASQEGRGSGEISYPLNTARSLDSSALVKGGLTRDDEGRTRLDAFFLLNINFIALSPEVRKIITAHDLSFERYPQFFSIKRRLWHWFINPKKLMSKCETIIAVSENTKRDLMELYGIAEEKVKVVYSGVKDESRIKNYESRPQRLTDSACDGGQVRIKEVKDKYNLPEKFILFVGTLEPRKNIEGLIRAFEIFKKDDNGGYKLVIVGPRGWLDKKIFAHAGKSQYSKYIKFIDYISEEEKWALYGLAKLFVYPSFYEGFGFPPPEAASCGVPVIVSASSSLPEVMNDAAVLVNPNNPAEIAKAMSLCLSDENLRQELIKKGQEQAKKFSWDDCARRVTEILITEKGTPQ